MGQIAVTFTLVILFCVGYDVPDDFPTYQFVIDVTNADFLYVKKRNVGASKMGVMFQTTMIIFFTRQKNVKFFRALIWDPV